MNVSEFIAMATKGDEAEARAALEQDPGLAAARDQNGVSLIGLGADVDTPARNGLKVRPLHSAVANSDPDKAGAMARSLLAAGAAPNAKQQGGFTPLQAAALHGNLDLVRLLLESGADPGLVNESGATAVDLAESAGHAEVVQILRSS